MLPSLALPGPGYPQLLLVPPPPLQDGGDPAVEVSPRDIIYTLCADAASAANGAGVAPRAIAKTDLRCGGVAWGDDDLAIVYEVRARPGEEGCVWDPARLANMPPTHLRTYPAGTARVWKHRPTTSSCAAFILLSLCSLCFPAHDSRAHMQSWWKSRRSVWWLMSPGQPEKGMQVLFDRWVWVGSGGGASGLG